PHVFTPSPFPTRRSSDLYTIGFVLRPPWTRKSRVNRAPLLSLVWYLVFPLVGTVDSLFTVERHNIIQLALERHLPLMMHSRETADRKSTRLNSSHVSISY